MKEEELRESIANADIIVARLGEAVSNRNPERVVVDAMLYGSRFMEDPEVEQALVVDCDNDEQLDNLIKKVKEIKGWSELE